MTKNQIIQRESHFWINQPLLKEDKYINDPSIITELKLSTEKYTSDKYIFDYLNILDDKNLLNLVSFINKNYYVSETKKNISYDKDFLYWILIGGDKPINLSLKYNNKICGFIHGSVFKYQFYNKQIDFVEVSFLTIDNKYRNKGIAEILINELKKYYNSFGYQIGIFSTTKHIGKYFTNYKTFYRPINYIKLIKTGFIDKAEGNIDSIISYYAINGKITNLVKINPSYYEKAYELYCTYMEKYIFHRLYTYEQFIYWYCSENVNTYVFLNDNNEVIDLLSYYITYNNENLSVSICNLYLYTSLINNPLFILKNLVLLAKQNNYDVVMVTNILENDGILLGNKYIQDISETNIYLFNYTFNMIGQNEIYYNQF
jgi:ribosomal protein S18 acetylase RimI-like enzyme